jgi:hypothetical protein
MMMTWVSGLAWRTLARTSMPDPGQLHLHQVSEVGLVVREEDAEAALMGLVHDWSSLSMRRSLGSSVLYGET